MTDHYQTLGVAKNATQSDIKKAYRRLAAIHHPDKGGDTAMFQKVQAAYETLSDPQKRQEYDNPNPFGQMGGNPFGPGGMPGGFHFSMNGFDMGDIFGQMFGGHGPRHSGRPQQPSYRTVVFITLDESYNGAEKILELQTQNGLHTAKINVPKGVDNGQSMRYDNLIPDGILIVEFRIQPDPRFERQGPTLFTSVDISVLDLIVGTTIKFKTISGKTLDVTVKSNSQPNSKLRISGEGMPFNNGYGDQYILLNPIIPAIIDARIVDAIKQYK